MTPGSKSYIAVVVIDGNRMGKKIEKFREDFQKRYAVVNVEVNRVYKRELNQLSQEIDDSYKRAVKKMVDRLGRNMESLKQKGAISSWTDKDGTIVLPIRPLILAGDDIAFVADARIALALVKETLKNIEAIQLPAYKDMEMRASAGVAMVRVQYPFFRAHELAEELCHNAKSVLSETKDASVIDFHIVQGEIAGSLSKIRREQYQNAMLTNKPYFLREQEDCSNTLPVFEEHMEALKKGMIGRGTVKEYRRALSEGEDAAKQYITDKRMDRRFRMDSQEMPESYIHGKCIDIDVLEVMDLYEQLEVE